MKNIFAKVALTACVILCGLTLGNTQTSQLIVMGNAYDSQSFNPVSGATVFCKESPSVKTYTGPEGDYTIVISSNSRLVCSHPSYKDAESDPFTSSSTWDPEMISTSSN